MQFLFMTKYYLSSSSWSNCLNYLCVWSHLTLQFVREMIQFFLQAIKNVILKRLYGIFFSATFVRGLCLVLQPYSSDTTHNSCHTSPFKSTVYEPHISYIWYNVIVFPCLFSVLQSSLEHIFENCFPPMSHPLVEEEIQPLESLLHDVEPQGHKQTRRR